MWRVIAGAGGLLAAGGVAIYKHVTRRNFQPSAENTEGRSLGSFVIWGRPNVGKTTFIARLRGLEPKPAPQKENTSSRTEYPNVTLRGLEGGVFVVTRIVDMPGTDDRFKDWLSLVTTESHVFYMIDLSRLEEVAYISRVKLDVAETVKALGASEKNWKRINIIASHVDKTKWGDSKDDPQLANLLQSDPEIRALYESLNDVSGYIYSGDLTEKASFQRMLQSIVNDCSS